MYSFADNEYILVYKLNNYVKQMKLNQITKKSKNDKIITIEDIFFKNNSLSLFQKTLLITDGTVTNLLKLYTQKDIFVKKLNQELILSGLEESKLCKNKTPILKREILLGHKDENYIYANSIFIFENISRITQHKLLESDCPIGLLWKNEKIDTFRDIIEIRIELCNHLTSYFGVEKETQFLARKYIIYNNLMTLGVITEKFPITYFR